MELKILKFSLAAVFLISLASVGAIVVLISPFGAGFWMLALLSLVVFLTAFSVFSWIGLKLRKSFITEANLRRILKMIFRQSAWLAVLALGLLWANHFGYFKIWTAVPLLIIIIAAEYYFLSRGK